ncbi:MAG: hypothetical protein ACYDC7_08905 [Acidithiobacillus ferrivorans]
MAEPFARPETSKAGQHSANLAELLRAYQGNRRRVGDALGISEQTAYRWL